MPRAAQQNNAGENLPVQQQQERKVIEREKPYEFDDILNGVGVLEIMQDASVLPTITTFLLRMIFTYHNLKSNYLV